MLEIGNTLKLIINYIAELPLLAVPQLWPGIFCLYFFEEESKLYNPQTEMTEQRMFEKPLEVHRHPWAGSHELQGRTRWSVRSGQSRQCPAQLLLWRTDETESKGTGNFSVCSAPGV